MINDFSVSLILISLSDVRRLIKDGNNKKVTSRDTIKPTITPLGFSKNDWISNLNYLKFKIKDAQTGIKNYTLKAIKEVKKQTKGKIPIGIGFGISTPDDVKTYVKAGADAVIVGSAYLKLIEKTSQNQLEVKITSFTKSLKQQTKV